MPSGSCLLDASEKYTLDHRGIARAINPVELRKEYRRWPQVAFNVAWGLAGFWRFVRPLEIQTIRTSDPDAAHSSDDRCCDGSAGRYACDPELIHRAPIDSVSDEHDPEARKEVA